MWTIERTWWRQGIESLAGVDEAGRGPLAGPVVAAAVVLPPEGHPGYRRARRKLVGLDDSKQLPAAEREAFYEALQEVALAIGVGVGEVGLIDRVNILQATFHAMREALSAVAPVQRVLVDGNRPIPGLSVPQEALVGGDGLSASIAAASVIAKVTRDRMMVALDAEHPGYGFAQHKGYCTVQHVEAIGRHGPCTMHRKSFRVPAIEELRPRRGQGSEITTPDGFSAPR